MREEDEKGLFLVLALLVGLAPGVQAQFATGNVYGTVTDESGAVLPGAAVTLTSDLGNRSTTTGTQGEFRFLNLDRGRYKVTVAIAGFTHPDARRHRDHRRKRQPRRSRPRWPRRRRR